MLLRMETTAFLFHDADGTSVGAMELKAGDDAAALKWQKISGELDLYASHKELIRAAAQKLNANW